MDKVRCPHCGAQTAQGQREIDRCSACGRRLAREPISASDVKPPDRYPVDRKSSKQPGPYALLADKDDPELLARTVLERLPKTSVLVLDADLRVVLAAGRAFEKHGVNPRGLIGRDLVDVMPAAASRQLEPAYREALGGDAVSFVYESFDGAARYRVTAEPFGGDGREASGLIVLTHDITDLESEMDAKLAAMQDTLLAAITGAQAPVPLPAFVAQPRRSQST